MPSVELAYQKPVTSSPVLDVYPEWNASQAVDGNNNSNVYCGSCLHTQQQLGGDAYLQIDLQEIFTIHHVEIFSRQCYNQTDCLGHLIPSCNRGKKCRLFYMLIHLAQIIG